MLEAVRLKFDDQKIDALLVTSKTNIFYLSGFLGSSGAVLVTKNHAYLFTDGRYLDAASKALSKEWEVIDLQGGLVNVLQTILAKHRVKKLGVEITALSALMYKRLESLMGIKLAETTDLVETIRASKTDEELRILRQAQRLNEQVLKLTLDELKINATEAGTAWKIKMISHDLGADELAFDPIVAFGANTANPHHLPSLQKKLKRGDLIMLDLGIKYRHFCADLTRMFFTKTPTGEQAMVYSTVLAAQERSMKAIKPGVEADLIDKESRMYISDAGFKKKFLHSTGHGVGLDIHELPRLAKGDKGILRAGMLVTVEPGIYLAGKFGVRIEDVVEVTESGHKVLTVAPKSLELARLKI